MVKHLDHIEDVFLLEGTSAVHQLTTELVNNNASISLKWDGSPSIVAGRTEDGVAFIATKSYFNKIPVFYKSISELDTLEDVNLRNKLRVVLTAIQMGDVFEPGTVMQGDLMFYGQTVKEDGPFTFQPNVIRYTVHPNAQPEGFNQKYHGVAWHTVLSGTAPSKMMYIWSLPIELAFEVPSYIEPIAENPEVDEYLEKLPRKLLVQYTNHCIRNNATIDFCSANFLQFIHLKYQKEIDAVKTQASKDKKALELQTLFASLFETDLVAIQKFFIQLERWKHRLLQILNNSVQTDFETSVERLDGTIEPCAHEGFVAITNYGSFKLVDRYTFSRLNFSNDVVRGWSKYGEKQ